MAYMDYQRQRAMTLQDLLLENRIIFVEGPIDDVTANNVVMKMLFLQSEKKNEIIHLYVNSPGGYVSSTMAVYDTIQFLECDVATYCIGLAASGAALLMTGGSPGKRFILPHAKMMIHQPAGEVGGQASDIEIAAREVLKDKETLIQLFAQHTGKPADQIRADIERDRYLSAKEAVEYGLADTVVTVPEKRRK
jgi:ATP-dependent Clp protease, protease subunit